MKCHPKKKMAKYHAKNVLSNCHAMKSCCQKRGGMFLPPLAFFMGLSLGFLFSPIKQGIGNNSGNTSNHYYGVDEPTDDPK